VQNIATPQKTSLKCQYALCEGLCTKRVFALYPLDTGKPQCTLLHTCANRDLTAWSSKVCDKRAPTFIKYTY